MVSKASFPALTGFYQLLFLYIEPISTILPCFMVWLAPGAAWFHHQLIPSPDGTPVVALDARSTMAIWQLGNCYLLLGMMSSIMFRAVRNTLQDNPVAQERIIGASLFVLAFADITHIVATFLGLPEGLRYDVSKWNPTTHGNISAVVVLFLVRVSWFMGIGRTSYYYGRSPVKAKVA